MRSDEKLQTVLNRVKTEIKRIGDVVAEQEETIAGRVDGDDDERFA